MFGNKEYRFIQEFSSPLLGNVYIGRIAHLPQKSGQKFVEAGLAVEIKEKQKAMVQHGRGHTAAGKITPKGDAK